MKIMIVLLLLAAVWYMPPAEGLEIKFTCSDAESFPNVVRDGTAFISPPGIAVEIIKKACDKAGIHAVFERLPNIRVLYSLKYGETDAAFLYSYNQEREEYGVYPFYNGKPDRTLRLASQSYYLYKKLNSDISWNGSSITGTFSIVGANSGYSIIADLKKLGIKVEDAKTTERNLKKLELGRIDAYVSENIIVCDLYAEMETFGKIVKEPFPLITKDYYLIFSNEFMEKNPAAAKLVWQYLGELRDELTKTLKPEYSAYIRSGLSKK
jgi:polar amino acid transport system substrate-binding protein